MINAFSTLWGGGLSTFGAPSQPQQPQQPPINTQINAFNVQKANNSFDAIKSAQNVKKIQKQAKFYYKNGKYLVKKED